MRLDGIFEMSVDRVCCLFIWYCDVIADVGLPVSSSSSLAVVVWERFVDKSGLLTLKEVLKSDRLMKDGVGEKRNVEGLDGDDGHHALCACNTKTHPHPHHTQASWTRNSLSLPASSRAGSSKLNDRLCSVLPQ